ncbi:DNA-binding MarR family transcriptional regulator [Murinocardiopsis flavida]|uniref:DNA-binding MarR family transcriptional regulator n=1 Tax=Murinocardiopsis flavida TaxID=645275 RepID=A0A2P8DUP7_9ACTN|nr:MarR family transcriptional regulator [Murinocardiopsis flavida]PSL00932.1 DNA-binding MarR family transcriptional regulator [Murinocardiopsis flavida]
MSSDDGPAVGPRRAELLGRLGDAGRRMSNAAVMFHTVLSEKLGMSSTDWKTLDLLDRHGPLTAGELVRHSGLAPASITGVIDRLERSGHVSRSRDENDRRRVVVSLDKSRLAEVGSSFEGLTGELAKLYGEYDDDQLALILDFVERSTEIQSRATVELRTQGG